jgi:hypothetical protein
MERVKMTKPLIKIYDIATDTTTEREMTNDEYAQWQLDKANVDAAKAKDEAKAAEKAALLDRLGITEDEAKLLLA